MLYAVIMAGGKGERFWPRSRARSPKQLLTVVGKKSMLSQTFERARKLVPKDRVLIVANSAQVPVLRKQIPGLRRANIIQEPSGRNTAAAVGLAAVSIERRDPEAVMAVLPADHIVSDYRKFSSCIRLCSKVAEETNALVTIGIEPGWPATGYGYIKINPKSQIPNPKGRGKVYKVESFVEKPDDARAMRFLKSGNYLWNSGIFVWKAKVILEAIAEHMPRLFAGLKRIRAAQGTSRYEQVLREVYSTLDPISIDYGVMEKAKNIFCIEANFGWDDLGSWACLERLYHPDEDGNVWLGKVDGIDTEGSVILGNKDKLVATVGVKDLIVVSTDDAVLVCDKERAEDVKQLVNKLGKNKKLKKYL